jgi:hypothetical protein
MESFSEPSHNRQQPENPETRSPTAPKRPLDGYEAAMFAEEQAELLGWSFPKEVLEATPSYQAQLREQMKRTIDGTTNQSTQ